MSILSRPLLHANERLDLEDWNLGLSSARTDSHYFVKSLISNKAFIMQGFTISQSFIGQPTGNISMTSASLINGNNPGDFSWWTAASNASDMVLPTGVGGLQNGRNYVELQLYALDGTPLQRAFWDPTANSGAGVEYSQQVNTITDVFVQVKVNQTNFTTGDATLIPLAIIDLDSNSNIAGIKDKRNLFHRLGQPDNINYAFPWGSQTEPTTTLTFIVPAAQPFVVGEVVTFTSGATASVVTGGTNNITVFNFSNNGTQPGDTVTGTTSGATATLQSYYESFIGGDKDIVDFKTGFDAVKNEIRAIKGTPYWYSVGAVASLTSLLAYVNAVIVPLVDGARFSWTGSVFNITDNKTTGQALSDPVAAIRVPGFAGNLIMTREDGTGGSLGITLPDQNVLYVQLPAAGASRTWSQAGPLATNFQIAPIASFMPTDKNYILAYREGTKIVVHGIGELKPGESVDVSDQISLETLAYIGAPNETSTSPAYPFTPSFNLSNQFTTSDSLTTAIGMNAGNINDLAASILVVYQEPLDVIAGSPSSSHQVTGPVPAGSILTLPLDSRNSNLQKTYKVGNGSIFLFLNGLALRLNDDFGEIGTAGALSSTIQILYSLVVGDQLEFRIINPQFIGSTGLDQAFFAHYIVGQSTFTVPVGGVYNTGTDRLQAWKNGLAMDKSLSVGDPGERYQELNQNTISLTSIATTSDVFTFINHTAPNPTFMLITGIAGTTLTVPTYTIGNGILRIFRNGLLMTTGVSAPADLGYTETATTTVTLALAASVSDVFKIYIAGAAPTWRKTLTGTTSTTPTIPGGVSFVSGSLKLLTFRNGILLYNSTSLGNPIDRYQQLGTTQIQLDVAPVTADFFEFLYI